MKKLSPLVLTVSLVVIGGLVFSGCLPKHELTNNPNQAPVDVNNKKVGDTTKSGLITKIGRKYFITEAGGEPVEIDSYSLDLSQYVGKMADVTGQYSGDTLFVREVNLKDIKFNEGR